MGPSEWAPPNWAPGRCWCGKLGPSNVGPPKSQIKLFRACALRALGLFLADGAPAPTVGWGKTFWRVSHFFFFYENSCNSETKSRKIDPKVRNRPSRRGLQTGHLRNPGPKAKNGFSCQNPNFWAKKTPISRF